MTLYMLSTQYKSGIFGNFSRLVASSFDWLPAHVNMPIYVRTTYVWIKRSPMKKNQFLETTYNFTVEFLCDYD